MTGTRVKFPYGNNDFYQLITEDYCYVDRTDRIARLEETGKTLLLLRPRRYGKSLLLSTLENYYDIAKADEFARLFGALAIGAQPTPLHNQYLILRWDFSIVAPKPDYQQQQQVLTDYLNAEIKAFALKYQDWLLSSVEINPTNATASFWSLLSVVQQANHKIYLLVDEYDNFANELLMAERPQNQARYEALVFGEGEFKAVFKAIKGAMSGRGVDRTFIVGVSPVVLHDVSSGFNIAENIYFREDFNDLCGFTEAEITQLLTQVAETCNLAAEQRTEALHLMRTFYNGALFSHEGGECIYNPTSTFHFLKYLQRTCRYPRNMLDTNLGTDHEKLAYVAGLPKGEEVILQIMDTEHPPAVVALEERFGVHEMLAESNTEPFMLSLLYYLGVLTLDGGLTREGELILRIPNLVMQQLYAERLLRMLLPDAAARDHGQAAAKELYSNA
ncbi:MAG: AAA family ATPase [Caldilineaceae bacterium]